MTFHARPLCSFCQHFNLDSMSCAAFPVRIPSAIIRMDHDHRLPYVDDQGIQFQLADGIEMPLHYIDLVVHSDFDERD